MQNQSPKALSKSWFYNLLANDGDVVGQKVCRRERQDRPTPSFTQVVIKGGVVVAAGPTLGLTRRTRVSRQPPNQSPIGGNARALSSAIPPPFPPATALSPACRALIEFSKLGDGTTIEERTGPPQHTNMVSGGSDDGNSQPRNSETNQTTVPVLTYSWETTHAE